MENKIQQFLDTHKTMVIAGVLPDGNHYAATTCYVSGKDLAVNFFVFSNSEKHQLVQMGQPFSLVIDEGFQIPFEGLELTGTARQLDGEELEEAKARLASTFPKLANVWAHPAIIVCQFKPEKVQFHDWNVKVGHVDVWEG